MNAKHRGKRTKYNGSLTVKKRPLRWGTNQNINHFAKKPHIKTRTYNRINNIVIHGGYSSGHGTHMIGGGEKDQGKDNAKKEEKARKEEAKRVLEEEKEKQKAAKKAEDEKAKKDKKDKDEKAKKDKKDKATKDAKNKDQNKPPENDKGANNAGNKIQPVATNNPTNGPKLNIADVTNTETKEDATGEIEEIKVTQNTSKVLKLDGPGANETDVDVEPEPATVPAGNKADPAGNKVKSDNTTKTGEAKKGRWASFKETMKKGASNAAGYVTQKAKNLGKGIKNVAWGDENTGKLGKAGRLLASPFSLPLTGLYKAAKGTYKLGVSSKDRAGLFVKRLGIPESMRLGKKFNTWKTTRKAATGELKKQKYEDKMQTKKDEISGYSAEIIKLEAKGESNLSDDEKQLLNKLRAKMESAEYALDLISIKNARWQTRSAKSKLELNKLQETRILPSTKQAIDNKIKQKQADLDKNFEKADLDIKKNVASRVANLDTDTDFQRELSSKQTELDTELANKLNNSNLNDEQKQFIETEYARQKTALAQKLKDHKEAEFTAAEIKKLAEVKKAAQTQIYNTQITTVATKLGINIDAENPQLKALLWQHHADPNAKPLTGEELIKKVSEVGFSNIVANKQTVAQANKYLSAPHAMFKPRDKEAAITTLGNNSVKQSFYKEYVRDAKQKLDAKLTELPKGANNAKVKMELTRLKAKLDIMDKDKRFTGAAKDLYLYNLVKSKEELLGISTAKKVKEASNAKLAIQDKGKLETAITAYYNARTKNLGTEGLEKLAAIYNPDLKADLAPIHKKHYIQIGLQKYKDHIKELLQKNPLALKVENPTIYNKIFNSQKSEPSTANNNIIV